MNFLVRGLALLCILLGLLGAVVWAYSLLMGSERPAASTGVVNSSSSKSTVSKTPSSHTELPAATINRESSAVELLERAIQVHGGAEKLAKLKMFTVSGEGTIDSPSGPIRSKREAKFSLPNKGFWEYALTIGEEARLNSMAVVDERGWMANAGNAVDLPPTAGSDLKEYVTAMNITTLLPLREGWSLSSLPPHKVNGKSARGLKASQRGFPDMILHFDEASGLLVRLMYNGSEAGVARKKEFYFSEHKPFEGLILHTRQIELADEKRAASWNFSGYTFVEKFDKDPFAKP